MNWEWLESRITDGFTLAGGLGLAWWMVRADFRRRGRPSSPRGEAAVSRRSHRAGRGLNTALILLVGGALLRWVAGEDYPGVAVGALLLAGAGTVTMGIYLERRLSPAGGGGKSEEGVTSSPPAPKATRRASPSETP